MNKVFFSFMLFFAATTMNAQIVKGDMNGDGELNVTDVTSLVDVILDKAPKEVISAGGGDAYMVDNSQVAGTWTSGSTSFTLAEDGETNYIGASTYKFRPYQGTITFYDDAQEPVKAITINEVASDYLMVVANGVFTKYLKKAIAPDDHEYVDLDLPSGTLWATCNVGADSPEAYGDFFAWGETDAKDTYSWSTYKWCNGSESTLTKYCNNSSYGYNGYTDTMTELVSLDDAAYVNWGSNWRMPTIAQFEELIDSDNTRTEWTTQNGVKGRLITSVRNDNTIFLPAAGENIDLLGGVFAQGGLGDYWSRTLNVDNTQNAWVIYFGQDNIKKNNNGRWQGRTVRPVRLSQ